MYEEDLKRLVCIHPELIEDGFTVLEEEYPIRAEGTCYRCDLKGVDKNGENVFVELKLKAGENVLFQIAKYKTFGREPGRYLVAAFDFDYNTQPVLEAMGFEVVLIDQETAERLLEKEKDNPELYQRKSTLTPRHLKLKLQPDTSYTEAESQIVLAFFQCMNEGLRENEELLSDFTLEGLDVRGDKYRLLFSSNEHPTDRLLLYNRARKSEEIHFLYVPDFSFTTGRSTGRKKRFQDYVLDNEKRIESIFQLPLYKSRRIRGEMGERLEITSQAWKGFSRVYIRPLSRWEHPDFIEFMVREFLDFVEKLRPLLVECFAQGDIVLS